MAVKLVKMDLERIDVDYTKAVSYTHLTLPTRR